MKRLWPFACGLLMLGVAHANLLRHATLDGVEGQVPRGMFHGVGYDASTGPAGAGTLSVNYRNGKAMDGRPYTEVELSNRASQSANYTLNLSTSRIALAEGQTYSLSTWVSVSGPIPRPVVMNLGFQLYQANGGYLSEWVDGAGAYQAGLGGAQQLKAEIAGGVPDQRSGRVPDSGFPRLAVYNIPAGSVFRFRFSGVVLTADSGVKGVQVLPVNALPQKVAPGAVLPLTVGLRGRPQEGSGEVVSSLALLSVSGGSRVNLPSTHSLVLNHSGRHEDVWQVRLPKIMPNGKYELWYELPRQKVRTRLGVLEVSQAAGMWVGYSFHRYPGASESTLGPLQARYQLARSLASDLAYGVQWWLGPDEYDWRGLMRWAQFHANENERKLVMTFSGTPRWASAAPHQRSAMGLMGYAAPPAAVHRAAYQRMVKETVTRLKGRLLATECWNEPNSRDFFTGTQTDLADLCKAVYVSTKAVEPTVPVICPQADDPVHMDFVYSARTSAGEPIHQFCDVVGAHLYNRLGSDARGRDYSKLRLRDGLEAMAAMSRKHGINKPLAITEFGISSCVAQGTPAYPQVFGRMRSEDAAEALYRSLAQMREFGVMMVALYSFDLLNRDPECLPGGSFIRMTELDAAGRQRVDPVVLRRVNDAVSDFGWRGHD